MPRVRLQHRVTRFEQNTVVIHGTANDTDKPLLAGSGATPSADASRAPVVARFCNNWVSDKQLGCACRLQIGVGASARPVKRNNANYYQALYL